MSYANGRVYTEVVGGQQVGVSIYDVQRALQTGNPDLGALCSHININKWAKCKPVRYYGFPLRGFSGNTEFERKTGLTIGNMIDYPSQVAGFEDIEIEYQRPNGTINAPYRLSDFNGYDHYAQKPIEITFGSYFKLDRGASCSVHIFDRSSSADESGYITFTDILNDITGHTNFKNSDKRLCLAVYDSVVSDTQPIWYFFSDKLSEVGSNDYWSVSTNMYNTNFTNLLTVGKTYKFLVMMVSNHAYLEDIVSGDRYRWEFGVSPTEMATMESGQNPIEAMCLSFTMDEDRTEFELQNASVITDLNYMLDYLCIEKFGTVVESGTYHKLCTQITVPAITVRSRTTLNSSAQYQLRVAFNSGNSNYEIFKPTDKVGNDYFEIEPTPSSSLGETNLTPFVTVSDIGGYTTETDGQGHTIYVYEFDFFNRTFTILSRSEQQTAQENSGLFLFFDEAGYEFDIQFKLYYKPNSSQSEILVHTFTVTYERSNDMGVIYDIEF